MSVENSKLILQTMEDEIKWTNGKLKRTTFIWSTDKIIINNWISVSNQHIKIISEGFSLDKDWKKQFNLN